MAGHHHKDHLLISILEDKVENEHEDASVTHDDLSRRWLVLSLHLNDPLLVLPGELGPSPGYGVVV